MSTEVDIPGPADSGSATPSVTPLQATATSRAERAPLWAALGGIVITSMSVLQYLAMPRELVSLQLAVLCTLAIAVLAGMALGFGVDRTLFPGYARRHQRAWTAGAAVLAVMVVWGIHICGQNDPAKTNAVTKAPPPAPGPEQQLYFLESAGPEIERWSHQFEGLNDTPAPKNTTQPSEVK